MDSRKRSLVKALTWRVFALIITIGVSFAFLGTWSTSIAIGLASNSLKTVGYYIHERVWEKSRWGET